MTNKAICFLIILLGVFNINAQITSYPYIEDFENGAAGWSVEVPNTAPVTSWQLGVPVNSIINYAASGNNAWVTNLSGNYLFNENGWVQSPVFDFSSMTNPIISLYVFWNCEYMYDGAVIQSSIDSGSTWQNIGVYGTDPNWFTYNNIFSSPGDQGEGWSGTLDDSWGSGYYYNLSRELLGLGGQNNVIIRFVFASDQFVNDEGLAFDLVKIRDCYAGEDNNLFTCVNSSSGLLSLNSLLDENAALDGTWTSNNSLNILENNQIDLSQITSTDLYDFTYTVSDGSSCFDQASIVINAQLIPSAGEDIIGSVCATENINLYSYLSVDARLDGTWTSNDGLTIMNQGVIFQPQILIENIDDGVYTFTYNVSSPNCGSDSSLLTLDITKALSAGENATYGCSSLTSVNELFTAIGGTPDPSGRWEPNEADPTFGNEGTYRYIHDATSNCPEISAEVVFSIEIPDAGFDREYFVGIENDNGNKNLDNILNEFSKNAINNNQQKISRRWAFSSGPRSIEVDDSGDVNFPNTGAGPEQAYIFIYNLENDCGEEDSAIITVYIGGWNQTNEQSTLEICENETASRENLFDSLTKEGLRDFDNDWRDTSNNIVSFPVGIGIYTYEDSSLNTATVTVTQVPLPDAGPDQEYYDIIIGNQNLDDILNGLSNKSSYSTVKLVSKRWSYRSGPRTVSVEDDGGVNFPNTGAGPDEEYSFTYTVENDCGEEDSAIITLYVIEGFDIGENSSLSICPGETATKQDLFDSLTKEGLRDLESDWKDENGQIVSFPLGAGTYYYEDFSFNTATVTVTEITPEFPDAGPDREYYLTWAEYDLDVIISEGSNSNKSNRASKIVSRRWSYLSTSGSLPATVANDSEVDFPNTGAGGEIEFTFIYTVENECGETDEAEITFYLNDSNLWEIDMKICEGETLTEDNLFASMSSLFDGKITFFNGSWQDNNGSSVTFPVDEGIYTYTNLTSNIYDITVSKTNPLIAKVFLQGAMLNPNVGEENLMRDDLRVLGFIPTNSPYDNANCDESVFNTTGGNAIVDWVLIELRNNSFSGYSIEYSRSALLQRDGDIVDVDGISSLCISSKSIPAIPYNTSYYLVIKHRNHLSTMTENVIPFGDIGINDVFDFTNTNTPISFGINAQASFGMPTNILGMWAGDADNDGNIGFANDGNQTLFDVLFHPSNTTYSSSYSLATGYIDSDVNLDGIVSFQDDLNNILTNVIFYPGNTTYNSSFGLFNEQLPTTESSKVAKEKRAEDNQQYIQDKINEIQQKQ